MDGFVVAIVSTAVGITILAFRHPLGDCAEERFGHLNFGMPDGYTKASVTLLGFVLAAFGIVGLITLLAV